MGSYAQCWLDDLHVGSSKNDIDTGLITLFRASDKVITSELPNPAPEFLQHYQEALAEDPECRVIYYETPAKLIKDRLAVLGYDLETAKAAFKIWIEHERRQNANMVEKWQFSHSDSRELMLGNYENDERVLAALTPELWITTLKEIKASRLQPDRYGRYEGPHQDAVVGFMLSNDWYGFPGYDIFVPLRLALEAHSDGQSLIYDVTDLVWGGYFDADEDLVAYGLDEAAGDYRAKSKIIVLTEGKTDAWVLSEAMTLLYPHLRDYYSFLDFENSGFGGGVGNLANIVKAFSGAGIVNNVIALFDNDTAAATACRNLETSGLSDSIAIYRLPYIEFLASYPTLGPSGLSFLDVNGMAASIELYLGPDVLRSGDTKYVPVQWTGYDKSERQYQGEVLDKAKLHARFREKIKEPGDLDSPNWQALRAIFELIFSAFEQKNRKSICRFPAEYYAR